MIADDDKKRLSADPDGLLTYEYMANHIADLTPEDMEWLAGNMTEVDLSGQFVVSAARYLFATDPTQYRPIVDMLIAAGIDKDRERRYIGDILEAVYGKDYAVRADVLSQSDDNFRRIYKRLFRNDAI